MDKKNKFLKSVIVTGLATQLISGCETETKKTIDEVSLDEYRTIQNEDLKTEKNIAYMLENNMNTLFKMITNKKLGKTMFTKEDNLEIFDGNISYIGTKYDEINDEMLITLASGYVPELREKNYQLDNYENMIVKCNENIVGMYVKSLQEPVNSDKNGKFSKDFIEISEILPEFEKINKLYVDILYTDITDKKYKKLCNEYNKNLEQLKEKYKISDKDIEKFEGKTKEGYSITLNGIKIGEIDTTEKENEKER